MCVYQTPAETQVAVANNQDAIEGVERDNRFLVLLLLLRRRSSLFVCTAFGMLLRVRLLVFRSRGSVSDVELRASIV